jgi:hypothetical protein
MFLETDFKSFWLAALASLGGLEALSVLTQYDAPYWEFDAMGVDGRYEQNQGFSTQITKKDRLPGELGWDPLGLKPTDPAGLKEMQTKEILNGRLAMIGVIGILAQELATGQKVFN